MPLTTTGDHAELLAELLALPASDRLARLLSAGDPESVLDALCEETDRLAAIEIGRALDASALLVALADELATPRARAETRRARAAAFSYGGQFREALATCKAAIAIAEAAGLTVAAARVRLASVQSLSELGRYDEAVAAGEAALAAFQHAGEPVLAARAEVSLGATHDRREDPVRALAHYDRALPALAGDPVIRAQIETNRGIALMGLDEYARAEEAFAAAVDAFSAGGLDWAAAIAEGNLAYLATRQGRIERALLHFERARRCLEADESPADLARLLAEQADALALLGMPTEARQLYQRVLPNLEACGLTLEGAQARAGLGRVSLELGRVEEAETELAMAAKALERLGQEAARARLDLVRAEFAAQCGRRAEARALAEDALDTLALRPSDAVLAHEQLAWRDMEAGEHAAAEAHIASALPVAERLDLAPLRARLLHVRGLARRGRGASDDALRDLKSAVEQIERARGALQAERFRTAFLGSHLAIYEDAVLAALDADETATADAFALVERAKSRALLDVVGGALDLIDAADREAEDPAEAELLTELARLRSELNWQYSRFDDAQADPTSFAEREEWRASIQRLESEFSTLEDRLAAAGGIAGLYAPPLGLDDALELVPTGGALVEYFIAGDEVLAFVLREGAVSVARRLATSTQLHELVGRVHFQIGRAVASAGRELSDSRVDRQLGEVRRELGALHNRLIAPIGDRLAGASKLLIVPHGALHALPFNALWDGRRHLIESCEIVYAPSVSMLAHLAPSGKAVEPPLGALVVGVPDRLAPWIETEAQQVAAVLGVSPVIGREATTDRVSRDVAGRDIVHLACHGRFSPDRPLASGLKLADGWLTVRDIYALRLGASLVTLSGCETGRATVGGGDELTGLVRGFFAAGARSLLISLWTVNDESTAALMADFYDAYREGAAPAAALRGAQRAALARNPHPAFWAPFMLGGHS